MHILAAYPDTALTGGLQGAPSFQNSFMTLPTDFARRGSCPLRKAGGGLRPEAVFSGPPLGALAQQQDRTFPWWLLPASTQCLY